jgi:ubiquitin C-terminal hydrolase
MNSIPALRRELVKHGPPAIQKIFSTYEREQKQGKEISSIAINELRNFLPRVNEERGALGQEDAHEMLGGVLDFIPENSRLKRTITNVKSREEVNREYCASEKKFPLISLSCDGENSLPKIIEKGSLNYQRQGKDDFWEGNRFNKAPPVLMVHLKRWKHQASGIERIESPVEVPLYYSLPSYACEDGKGALYELQSYIIQKGGVNSGHYICYEKSVDSKGAVHYWECNDGKISEIPLEFFEELAKSSYLVSYVKKKYD